MAVDHREIALPHGELGAESTGAATGAPVRKSGLWRDALIRFTRNRAAVAAVATVDLDLVGMAVHGPRNAVDRVFKGARMHS